MRASMQNEQRRSPPEESQVRLIARSLRILAASSLLVPISTAAQWSTSVSRDEMTGKKQVFATSPTVPPTTAMESPYNDTGAWLGFGCDGQNEWAYVGFSNEPNLSNAEPQDGGYSSFTARVKWDTLIDPMHFRQQWGAHFLHFVDADAAIMHMMSASSVLLELQWYGTGDVYFRFSLRGAAAAIAKARAACAHDVQPASIPEDSSTHHHGFEP